MVITWSVKENVDTYAWFCFASQLVYAGKNIILLMDALQQLTYSTFQWNNDNTETKMPLVEIWFYTMLMI